MFTNQLGDILNSIIVFFSDLFKNNGLDFDVLLTVSLGLMVIVIIIAAIRLRFSFERSAVRSIKKINKYLLNNISITEENLVEFHKYMQKMPQKIKERWQLYILEREGLPSRYITAEYCIRRPLSTSVMLSVQKLVKYFAIVLSVITFIFALGYTYPLQTTTMVTLAGLIDVLAKAVGVPAIIILLASIFNMIVQSNYSSLNAKIYDEFENFVRNVNKAVATMPDSIDFQVLFSQKEIDEGIPILREYFEKQNLEEQQILEQSKYAALAHSPYDFKELGVDGEQLVTRAVDESENFLMKKIGLQNEIQDYEKKLAQSQANMDEIEKEANRKLQTIKENIERLNKAISETTNRVEINYNNRQIKEEMEKRAAVEKDLKSLLSKEQVIMNECNLEIEKRKAMIEEDKDKVEVALKSEYNTFAVKVYDILSNKLSEENEEVMKDYQNQIMNSNSKIKSLSKELESKDSVIAEKDLIIATLKASNEESKKEVQPQQAPVNQEVSQAHSASTEDIVLVQEEDTTPQENLMTTEASSTDQNEVVYDDSGNVIDYSQYFDEDGNFIGEASENVEIVKEEETPNNSEDTLVISTQPEQEGTKKEELKLPYDGKNQLFGAVVNMPKGKKTTNKKSSTKKKPEVKKGQKTEKKPASKAKATSKPKSSTKKVQEKKVPVKTTSKKKASTIKVAQESLKSAETQDDFNKIQKQIAKEQQKLKKNKDELQAQISKALNKMESSSTKTSRATSIKKIKELIEQLKEKAKQAKANGATKEEIRSINSSVAELVEVLTKFSSNK